MNNDKLLHELTNDFLKWPLPESVCADPCATKQSPGRIGTNLLSYPEARQMMSDLVAPRLALLVTENEALKAALKEARIDLSLHARFHPREPERRSAAKCVAMIDASLASNPARTP